MAQNEIGNLMAGVLEKLAPVSDVEAARLAAEARSRDIESKRDSLERAGVPARMLTALARGGPVRPTPALDVVTRWLASEDHDLLVISGGVGCGKTFAAAWACTQSRWPVFCDPLTLASIKRFEGQFNADDVAPLANCTLLVLDDLAAEFVGDKGSTRELIEAVLTRRHARALRTLVTTNGTEKEFHERYGKRIESRLKESSSRFVSVGGVDLRAVR